MGRAAVAPQYHHARLDPHAAVLAGGRAADRGAPPSGPCVGAAAPPAWLDGAAAGASRGRTRPGRHRPVGQAGLAADQANAQRRRACLVFFDESALSLTPNVRRTWAPKGRPPTLTHPFNWKKASMAAALCYGVRGGGAQLAFHVRAGNYDTDSLIEVLQGLRRFLGGEKATLLWDGLPSHRSTTMRDWIRTQRSWLVVERLPAYAPELKGGRGPVVQPQGRRAGQPHHGDAGRGGRPGPPRHRPGAPHPAPGLLVPAPRRPVGLLALVTPPSAPSPLLPAKPARTCSTTVPAHRDILLQFEHAHTRRPHVGRAARSAA